MPTKLNHKHDSEILRQHADANTNLLPEYNVAAAIKAADASTAMPEIILDVFNFYWGSRGFEVAGVFPVDSFLQKQAVDYRVHLRNTSEGIELNHLVECKTDKLTSERIYVEKTSGLKPGWCLKNTGIDNQYLLYLWADYTVFFTPLSQYLSVVTRNFNEWNSRAECREPDYYKGRLTSIGVNGKSYVCEGFTVPTTELTRLLGSDSFYDITNPSVMEFAEIAVTEISNAQKKGIN